MYLQRSSFLQKLMSTSSNLCKKELCGSHLKGIFLKLWNKANKKAVSAFRTFLEKWWSLFLEKFLKRLLLATLTQINSTVVISREFPKSFETIIKNVLSFRNVSDGIISGKITGGYSVFSLKKKEFCCFEFCRFCRF